ncbi:hypothetical protein BUALT_Bualt16G0083800 [Buddleja alternifolia]|uniref:Uncharacterized protein n=1 Tax=Buddleja alternifolia TaxID=168488 RepID=A0AAV6WKW3_9LAMI|nr:hypothetical protein BUALT_Bualt16G0083800 [Buddleja alternifolia]
MEHMSQAGILYANGWASEHNTCFITSIVAACGDQSLSIDSNNTTVIQSAMDELNHKFGTVFTFFACKSRLQFLYERHTVFYLVIAYPGVRWDRDLNQIFAQPGVMAKLMKENEMVMTYLRYGDPAIAQLNYIFGPRVIDVSSDSSRSNGIALCGFGPNDTIVIEDKALATRDDETLTETTSSTERIMLKFIRGRMITPKVEPSSDNENEPKRSGVEWDEARCIVRASKQQCEEWRVTIPLSGPYIYYGDDKYEDLKRLYASPYAGTLTNPWEAGMVLNANEKPCP